MTDLVDKPTLEPITKWDRCLTVLSAPIDGASLAVFRVGFGLLMAAWSIDYLASGRVHEMYVVPKFHFTYYRFDFVRPWAGAGMYLHFVGLAFCGVAIALGFLYRIATTLFALGFTYFFLLDRTNYQNHYYLLLLLSWLLVLLPLNRLWSFDANDGLAKKSSTLPAWCLWSVRFHIGLPYFFGGVAKLHPDWFAGEPLRTHLVMLSSGGWMTGLGSWVRSEALVTCFVWGGLAFDLGIVPLLMWRRTRILAYILCLMFHLTNAMVFNIHIFPWFMMFATTVFFEPDWPRRVIGLPAVPSTFVTGIRWRNFSRFQRAVVVCGTLYCAFHLVWPFRHFLYRGDAAWTDQGHHFSWRMMLRGKISALRYYLTDPSTGETHTANLRPYLNLEQVSKFTRDPEMILQLAHFLAREHKARTGREVEVRALVLTSLNGRKPQLLIDPNVDLAREPRGFHPRPWIEPLREPLRTVAWSLPILQWERHVELPPMPFLNRTARARPSATSQLVSHQP